MEEITKKIQQLYVDDITAKYPLHRLLCLLIYLLTFYILDVDKDTRLLDAIHSIKIKFIFDASDGLFAKASIYILILSFASTLIGSKLNEFVKSSCFELLVALDKEKNYLHNLKESIATSPQNYRTNKLVINEISKKLDKKRFSLKAIQANSEIFLTFIGCLLLGIILTSFGWVDIFLAVIGVFAVIYIQYVSYIKYISEFLPFYVAKETLSGKDIVLSDKNEQFE